MTNERVAPLRRRFTLLAASAALALLSTGLFGPAPALAESYPSKPVKIIVPYAAGGGADVLARLLADRLPQKLGQPFVVENRTGAAGVIGANVAARSPADGYTLLLTPVGPLGIAEHLKPAPPYDGARDFAPIILVARQPMLFVVHPKVPAKDFKEFLALAKAKPGTLNFGSAGVGTENHLTGELLKKEAGIDMVHVAYRGGGPAIQALLAGEIDMVVIVTGAIRPFLADGRVRALVSTGTSRLPEFPDIPTTAELGLPGVDGVAAYGLVAPAGTPAEVIAKVENAVAEISDDPQYRRRMEELAVEVTKVRSKEYTDMLARERARWGEVIRFAKIETGS
jgi:tripartite-type tricarboxylate transporter receptor subunit TctC